MTLKDYIKYRQSLSSISSLLYAMERIDDGASVDKLKDILQYEKDKMVANNKKRLSYFCNRKMVEKINKLTDVDLERM